MENRAENHNDFGVFVLHAIIFHYAGRHLFVHQNTQQLQRQVSDYFNMCRTVVSVAHSVNSHNVCAFPVTMQFRVSFNFVHNMFQFSVIAIRYVENIIH